MLRRFLPAFTLSLSLASSAFGQAEGSVPTATARPAPQVPVAGAPPEAQISPPEHVEKEEPGENFTAVQNPAFPPQTNRAVPVQRGKKFQLKDVAGYFRDGDPRAAKQAFDRGDYEKVLLSTNGNSSSLPASYLRALALFRLKKWPEAASEFSKLQQLYEPLSDRCAFYAAQALEQLGKLEEAATAYGSVGSGSRMVAESRLSLFRVRRKQKSAEKAQQALFEVAQLSAPSFGKDVGAEALWLLADLFSKNDDPKKEKEALFALWSRHPLWKDARRVEERLRSLRNTPSAELSVARAEVLIDAHRNKEGLELLKPLIPLLKLPAPLACRAQFLYGKGLRKERSHSSAAEVLARVVTSCQAPDLKVRALYVLGSSRSIVDVPRGIATYLALSKEFPQHSFADDALYYAADLYLKNGQPQEALSTLADLLGRYSGGDFQSEARFKTYWILRSLGKTEDALLAVDAIRKDYRSADEGYDYERATYWRAKEHESARETEKALGLYEELLASHPATYYGLLSEWRLKALSQEAFLRASKAVRTSEVSAPLWPLHAGPLSDDPHFVAGVELLRLGFPEEVSAELLSANRASLPNESARLLLQLLSMAQDARAAHAVARTALRKDLSGQVTDGNRAVWEVAYPNVYQPMVERFGPSAQVEPLLLLALMREESALDPRALSWAGALGLTQLMPGTARDVAKKLKLPKPSAPALLQPELNIRLGAAYLGFLLNQFSGEKVYALASYNAGALNVKKWQQDKKNLSLDEWVEEIPLSETRGYVKRVLRSYRAYRLLYASMPPLRASNR